MKRMGALHVRGLDLNLLVVLDALLAEQNVTRAAQALHMSQSAVSHALARLRDDFGDPLLVRHAGGMTATPIALTLHEPVRRAIEELQRAMAISRGFVPAESEVTLKIGVTDYVAFVLLPTLMERVRKEAPGIKILARHAMGDRVAGDLASGQVDIGIGFVHDPPPNAHRRVVFREGFSCLMGAAVYERGPELTLDAYLAASHLSVSPRGAFGGVIDDALARLGKSRNVTMSTPHFLPAGLIAARSDLVLTVMSRVARYFAETLPLRLVEPPFALPELELVEIWHERTHRDPAYAWLRSLVAEVGQAIDLPVHPQSSPRDPSKCKGPDAAKH